MESNSTRTPTVLAAEDVIKSYSGRAVVRGVSVSVGAGEIVGLLGPNGAGKTTTFYMFVGVIAPESGAVTLNGQPITKFPMYQRARMGIAYLPQEASVFRKLTVRDNIMAVLETVEFEQRSDRETRCDILLQELGLGHVAQSLASSLSGGERRRTEIARALARNPSFILLDEPFAGIDPIAIKDIQNIVANLALRGIGVLITDHNVRETLGICHRAYIMVDGKVLEEGDPETISRSEMAQRFYLGSDFAL